MCSAVDTRPGKLEKASPDKPFWYQFSRDLFLIDGQGRLFVIQTSQKHMLHAQDPKSHLTDANWDDGEGRRVRFHIRVRPEH